MFKRILCVIITALTVTLMLSSCGQSGMKITAYDVDNGEFFKDCVRYYYNNGEALPEDSPYFALATSFSMSRDDFIKNFVQRYDSNFGMDLKILVENRNDTAVTVNGVRTENNGYEDTYISALVGLGGSVTLEPNSKAEITVHFLGNGGIYTNEEFLEVIMKEMDIALSCTFEGNEEKLLDIRIKPRE